MDNNESKNLNQEFQHCLLSPNRYQVESSSGKSKETENSHYEENCGSKLFKKRSKATRHTLNTSSKNSGFQEGNKASSITDFYTAPDDNSKNPAIKIPLRAGANLFEGLSCKFISSIKSKQRNQIYTPNNHQTFESLNINSNGMGPKLIQSNSLSPSLLEFMSFNVSGSLRSGIKSQIKAPSNFKSDSSKIEAHKNIHSRYSQFTSRKKYLEKLKTIKRKKLQFKNVKVTESLADVEHDDPRHLQLVIPERLQESPVNGVMKEFVVRKRNEELKADFLEDKAKIKRIKNFRRSKLADKGFPDNFDF